MSYDSQYASKLLPEDLNIKRDKIKTSKTIFIYCPVEFYLICVICQVGRAVRLDYVCLKKSPIL